ncbi:MAG: hypothetical protein KAS32_04980 [Candidatus Peribacteraceae bacterium]|nr:hypothetical protein [Candidatus Peribacteraceae bacterium]
MAYGIIPDMTNEDVVCQNPCHHTDCAANREDFITSNKCRVCGEALITGDKFCYEPEHGKNTKSHHRCLI